MNEEKETRNGRLNEEREDGQKPWPCSVLILCFILFFWVLLGTKKRKGIGNGWLDDGRDYGA